MTAPTFRHAARTNMIPLQTHRMRSGAGGHATKKQGATTLRFSQHGHWAAHSDALETARKHASLEFVHTYGQQLFVSIRENLYPRAQKKACPCVVAYISGYYGPPKSVTSRTKPRVPSLPPRCLGIPAAPSREATPWQTRTRHPGKYKEDNKRDKNNGNSWGLYGGTRDVFCLYPRLKAETSVKTGLSPRPTRINYVPCFPGSTG